MYNMYTNVNNVPKLAPVPPGRDKENEENNSLKKMETKRSMKDIGNLPHGFFRNKNSTNNNIADLISRTPQNNRYEHVMGQQLKQHSLGTSSGIRKSDESDDNDDDVVSITTKPKSIQPYKRSYKPRPVMMMNRPSSLLSKRVDLFAPQSEHPGYVAIKANTERMREALKQPLLKVPATKTISGNNNTSNNLNNTVVVMERGRVLNERSRIKRVPSVRAIIVPGNKSSSYVSDVGNENHTSCSPINGTGESITTPPVVLPSSIPDTTSSVSHRPPPSYYDISEPIDLDRVQILLPSIYPSLGGPPRMPSLPTKEFLEMMKNKSVENNKTMNGNVPSGVAVGNNDTETSTWQCPQDVFEETENNNQINDDDDDTLTHMQDIEQEDDIGNNQTDDRMMTQTTNEALPTTNPGQVDPVWSNLLQQQRSKWKCVACTSQNTQEFDVCRSCNTRRGF